DEMAEINTLGWFDYLIIAIMLCISAGIGYFIANRSMSILSVAIVMMASQLSALAFLSVSAENYIYGIIAINVEYFLSMPILCYGFISVFFKLQATSIYEYLGKRFGVRVKMMASFAYWIQQVLYSGLVLYASSLALEATVSIVGFVCAFYSILEFDKNMQVAQREWLCCPTISFFLIIISFSGLAIYSRYYKCDLSLKKRITSPNMLMPLYVMDTMSNISGLPGLFIAESALGMKSPLQHQPSSLKYSFLSSTAFLAQFLDELLQTFYILSGIIGEPLLGTFTLGMGTESAKHYNIFITFSFLLWIVFSRPIPPKLPITIKGCNNTNMTMSYLQLSFFK
ncbi:Putative sodium-dependent multivitamin transporter, partial [Atta colombica]